MVFPHPIKHTCIFLNPIKRAIRDIKSYHVHGSGESVIQWKLIPKLGEIKEAFAKADVVFRNLRTRDTIEGIKKGDIDFGVIRTGEITPDLDHIPVGTLQFAYFYPSKASIKDTNEADLLAHFPLATMEGEGRYQSFIGKLPSMHKIILKRSVSCSSFPMMAKTLNSIPIAAILPTIARDELRSDAFKMAQFKSLKPLEQDLNICWNKRLAAMNPTLPSLGRALAKILS